MAKKSKIIRNQQRQDQVDKYAERRAELKAELKVLFKDYKNTQPQIQEVYRKLREIPRDANPTRIRNRCYLTGRPRGYLRKFGLSRIAVRELALEGELPGVVKSSW